MNFNKIINNNLNKDDYSENSILINEIFIKNIYVFNINNNKSKTFKHFLFLIIIIFILISFINNKIPNNFYKIKLKKEIINLEQYYKICNDGILLNKTIKFKKIENPKISIISSIYNKQDYILRFLRSIQNQNFEQIEIILIDDCSEDNTVNIIENLQKEDERIRIIKNRKNKGTLPYGILFLNKYYIYKHLITIN